MPPSTTRHWPVMKRASSLSRKRATGQTSCTVPSRAPRAEPNRPSRVHFLAGVGELERLPAGATPGTWLRELTLRVEWSDLPLTASPVWARRPRQGGSWWCGVELDGPVDPAWRDFVDSLN